MLDAKSMDTPMATSLTMDKDETGKDVEITKYR
ncbi:hypothetical protein A2U01_0115779, partial [Trifolium medium]|nr:hypothetical protein [Trifolium medium]